MAALGYCGIRKYVNLLPGDENSLGTIRGPNWNYAKSYVEGMPVDDMN